jgi:clan AA aspartic protease (TIGR02281 family)
MITAIAYCIGLVVRFFKPLVFVAVAVFIGKAALPDRLPEWGNWLGSARAYLVSLAGQLRVPSLPAPPQWSKPDSGSAGHNRVIAGIDGSNACLVEGWAEGARFDFLADTGSYVVAFSRRDASRLGFNPWVLVYNRPYESANGTGYAARVRIKELRIGERVFHDVPADIDYNGPSHPLLAMPILRQFEFRVSGGTCELAWDTVSQKIGPGTGGLY